MSLKIRVVNFYNKNIHLGKHFIIKHFLDEGVPRRTVFRLVSCAERGESGERKKGSGRPAKICSNATISWLTKKFNKSCGISQKSAAATLKCSRQYVSMMLKKRTSIKLHKKTRKPKRTLLQLKNMRPKCRNLHKKYKFKTFVIDDESYFTLSNSTLTGNNIYYSDDVTTTPDEIKHNLKSKFEDKVLVWIAISSHGASKPFFVPSKQAIDQNVYLEECIKRRLMPFIKKHTNYVFWPDLASSHYAKSVIEYLRAQNINFVEKSENPANVPEARPIEDFWGDLKREVYKKNWSAKNVKELKRRIYYCLRKMNIKDIQLRASEVNKRLDHIARYGINKKK